MGTDHSIDKSEFTTPEEAAAYERWFRAKVESAMADTRPSIPHEQIMAEIEALIASKTRSKKSKP